MKWWNRSNEKLLEASESGDLVQLQACLRRRARVNAVNKEGCTPLMLASKRGDLEAMRLLIDRGADPNAVNQVALNARYINGPFTALEYACAYSNSPDAVRLLLDCGAGSIKTEDYGFDSLRWACHSRDDSSKLEIVKLLVERIPTNKVIGLQAAAELGWTEGVLFFLDLGVPVDAADEVEPDDIRYLEHTALWWAVYRGHLDTVQCLLARGAGPDGLYSQDDYKTQYGETPLLRAILQEDAKAEALLRQAGARNPIWDAAVQPPYYEIEKCRELRILLERGADINAVNPQGQTPLTVAVLAPKWINIDAIRFLLDRGARPDVDNWQSFTKASGDSQLLVLHEFMSASPSNVERLSSAPEKSRVPAAARRPIPGWAWQEALRTALLNEAPCIVLPVNWQTSNGRDPWECADLVEWLLGEGRADGNGFFEDGSTPLVAAVRANRPEMVGRLLALGADPVLADRSGRTPLEAATEFGNLAIMKMLTK